VYERLVQIEYEALAVLVLVGEQGQQWPLVHGHLSKTMSPLQQKTKTVRGQLARAGQPPPGQAGCNRTTCPQSGRASTTAAPPAWLSSRARRLANQPKKKKRKKKRGVSESLPPSAWSRRATVIGDLCDWVVAEVGHVLLLLLFFFCFLFCGRCAQKNHVLAPSFGMKDTYHANKPFGRFGGGKEGKKQTKL